MMPEQVPPAEQPQVEAMETHSSPERDERRPSRRGPMMQPIPSSSEESDTHEPHEEPQV